MAGSVWGQQCAPVLGDKAQVSFTCWFMFPRESEARSPLSLETWSAVCSHPHWCGPLLMREGHTRTGLLSVLVETFPRGAYMHASGNPPQHSWCARRRPAHIKAPRALLCEAQRCSQGWPVLRAPVERLI